MGFFRMVTMIRRWIGVSVHFIYARNYECGTDASKSLSPSNFGPLLTCAMRCRGGKSACHVFSDNAAFFHAEHGAI